MDAAQDWWFLLNHFLDKVDNFLALTIQFQFTIKCWYFIGFLIPTKEDNLKIIKVSKSRVFSSSFILIDKLEMVFHIFPSQKKKNGLLLLLGREETLGRLWGRSTLRQQSCKSAACFWYPSPRGGSTSAFVSKCEKKNKIFILIAGRSTWRNRRRNAYFRLPPSTLFPLFSGGAKKFKPTGRFPSICFRFAFQLQPQFPMLFLAIRWHHGDVLADSHVRHLPIWQRFGHSWGRKTDALEHLSEYRRLITNIL